VNLAELTNPEQTLIWEQGFMTPEHPQAERLLSVIEALKASGYDLATILSIVKGIQGMGYESLQELPKHFSIINNKYLLVPAPTEESMLFDINNIMGPALEAPPEEQKLMALTFWF
jgi:hypothetical protein